MTASNRGLELPVDERQLVHIARFPVRWTDMDAFSHVNNGTYFNYFDEARVSWWHAMGVTVVQPEVGPIIATAMCNFLKPLVYPANLQVKVYVSLLRRSSFTVYYEIEIASEPGVLYADGSTVVVWFDYQKNQSTPLPDELREKLIQFV